ncbi:MAG: M23 family metallopeptidase [Candidatus Rokubacteria bacterium]|nr:M23 family metallopeptidase [Candidatus Rokubacteria bacterium]
MRIRALGLLLVSAAVVWLVTSGILVRFLPLPGGATRDVDVPAAPEPEAAPATKTTGVELRRGDTLVKALARGGVDRRVGNEIATALSDNGADLRRLRPRDALSIVWNLAGAPIAVSWEPSPWLGFAVVSTDNGWEVRRAETRPDVRVEPVQGEVARSLFAAVEEARESPQLVLDFVEIFQSDFDFTADTRSGDRFRLLVEKRYAGESFVDYGRILVAQYVSDGRILTGVGFERPGRTGWGYYDPTGLSLRKSFLKSPLEFTRITSGFTYARPHPILGGVRPHLAVDYAAPIGTPVRAVADGVVARAGWDGGSGISIQLRHRAGYETMYNHLARLAADVRAGARVRQRQVIGYVGTTGLSTGPHLDYRVAKNGTFVNPLGEKFIPGEPIPASARTEFLQHARALVRHLERDAPF